MKRPREGFLQGVKVFFVVKTIPLSNQRIKIWSRRLAAAQGVVAKDFNAAVTHVVCGRTSQAGEIRKLADGRHVVSTEWLEDCLTQQQLLPEEQYPIEESKDESMAASEGDRSSKRGGPMRKFERWLGFWKPDFDDITTEYDLVMQAEFSQPHSERMGNEALVRVLVELQKYEDALTGDHGPPGEGRTERGAADDDHAYVNPQALSYARVASVVRACAYRIMPDVRPGDLPFVGIAQGAKICDILRTGTTAQLEAHRADAQIVNSAGKPRENAYGGKTRRLFKRLPGVGAATAKQWFDMGFRSYEDLEREIGPGGVLGPGGALPLRVPARFSLTHWRDLTEDCPTTDIDEMRAVVLATLEEIDGPGWEMDLVGGAARSQASHDADFVVSHPTRSTEGLVRPLAEALCAAGKLFPSSQAMLQIQDGRMPGHVDRIRETVAEDPTKTTHNLQSDRYDHIFGNYRTKDGRVRRIDLIITPDEERAFCVMSWTGSRQYLRFLRQYAALRGMHLNAHRLMVREEGQAYLVPDERPPRARGGAPAWPPGWHVGRRVRCEADIFELLGLPNRAPQHRNCP